MSTYTLQPITPRPFLKWAGGKTRLIQKYIPYFPKHFNTYYEPFLGGGAVFFHLLPTQSVLTDINPELINVYRCVRDLVEQVISLLAKHQENHSKAYYYQVRSNSLNQDECSGTEDSVPKTLGECCGVGHNPALGGISNLSSRFRSNDVEKAARLIYLNKTCFNGLYRENAKGEFNVPIGRYNNPRICNPDLLRLVSSVLQPTQIEVRSFELVLNYAQTSQDFVYFDPPYYPLNSTSNFTAYSRYSFGKDEQVKLRDTFVMLAKRGVKVMLSNSDCSFTRELYSAFKVHEVLASRAINSDAKRRGKIAEVLVTSY